MVALSKTGGRLTLVVKPTVALFGTVGFFCMLDNICCVRLYPRPRSSMAAFIKEAEFEGQSSRTSVFENLRLREPQTSTSTSGDTSRASLREPQTSTSGDTLRAEALEAQHYSCISSISLYALANFGRSSGWPLISASFFLRLQPCICFSR